MSDLAFVACLLVCAYFGWYLAGSVIEAIVLAIRGVGRLHARRRAYCPHEHRRGIYGDEINHTPGYRRLQCLDCGLYLDGPPSLATVRACG